MPQGAFPIGLRKQKKGIPTQPVRGGYKIGVVINVFTSMDDVGGRHINEAVGVVMLVMVVILMSMNMAGSMAQIATSPPTPTCFGLHW